MADPVTAAIEEIMEENVLPLPPPTSYLPPALLSLLAQVEDQLASYLPPHAQEKLKEVDAWGLEALGKKGERKSLGRGEKGGRDGGREGTWKGWSSEKASILLLALTKSS